MKQVLSKPKEWQAASLLFSILILFGFQTLKAQTTITGIISDEQGPLPGVNIVENGTTNGTTTDFDGNYSITVAEGATLVFTYIGYKAKEVAVAGETTINVNMEADAQSLDEVVVTGFGSQAKVDVTGAISQIKQEEIKQIVNADPTNALQGRLAGVQVESGGGQPGAPTNVIVRGISSLTNTFPLYVVDGTIVDDISRLNAKDIVDIQVLKDATSAAIYGTRAANGVIIVSTNRGVANSEPKVSIDIRGGANTVARKLDFLNGPEFVDFLNQRSVNEGLPANITDPGVNTDFQDLTLNSGIIQDYGFNVSGGGENSSYFFSSNYYDEEGIVTSTEFQRINLRLNSRFNIGKFTIEESLAYNQRDLDGNPFFGSGTFTAPIVRASAPERPGGFEAINSNLYNGSGGTNNYALAQLVDDQTTERNLIGNINLKYEIVDGLTLALNYGVDYRNTYANFSQPVFDLSPTDQQVNLNELNDLTERRGEILATNIEPTLNYKKIFGKHDFDILLGGARQQTDNNSLVIQAEGLPSDNITNIASFTDQIVNSGGGRFLSRIFSVFGRVNYKYDNRYLFTAIVRRDASSRFSPDEDFNNIVLPAFSAGWVMSNESWWPEDAMVNTFKVRGGYGELASQNIGDYLFQSVLNPTSNVSFNNTTAGGFAITSLVDPSISFETAQSTSFGIDGALFDNGLTFAADYYIRENNDVLAAVSVPSTTGSATPVTQNAASIRNTGFELSTNYNYDAEGDFKFNVGLTFATLTNELTELPNPLIGPSIDEEGNTPNRFEIGEEVGFFFGFENDGIYRSQAEIDSDPGLANDSERQTILQPGDFKRVDVNGDGMMNNDDRVNLGSPIPDFTYGVNFNGTYRNWDFGLNFNGVQGNEVFNATKFTGTFFLDGNKFGFVRDAFVLGQNENTNIPRASLPNAVGNQLPSDFYVEDGSYLRLRSLEIGYDLTKAINLPWVSNARIFYNMQNVFTITDYSGYDPEVGSTQTGAGGGFFGNPNTTPPIFGRGIDLGAQPRPRTFVVGVQASF